jgi:RNA polymerase sigma-70 factor (ECF subfamily)
MQQDLSFPTLMQRVRAGDADAAAALVREYEPEIRRAVRMYLTDPSMHRVLDSMDICQSVLGNFFVRAAAGQFELDQPEQLLKLLVTMARNKFRDYARRQHAARRDNRRDQMGNLEALAALPGREGTPSQIVAGEEMLGEVRRRLSADERFLAEQRALGRDWAEIAAEIGDSAEALRKRLKRAIDRVAEEMGLDEVNGE